MRGNSFFLFLIEAANRPLFLWGQSREDAKFLRRIKIADGQGLTEVPAASTAALVGLRPIGRSRDSQPE